VLILFFSSSHSLLAQRGANGQQIENLDQDNGFSLLYPVRNTDTLTPKLTQVFISEAAKWEAQKDGMLNGRGVNTLDNAEH